MRERDHINPALPGNYRTQEPSESSAILLSLETPSGQFFKCKGLLFSFRIQHEWWFLTLQATLVYEGLNAT